MRRYSLSHLADHVLLRDLNALLHQERTTTATLLAHLAEVDARKLYLPAAYPSMHAWCVGELHLSEDAASKRIHAARAASQFPVIFPALADGRLHLSAVVLLAPHLTEETAEELLAAAAHRTKAEIEVLLAQRFPRPDLPSRLQPIAPPRLTDEHAPGHVEGSAEHAPGHVEPPAPRARVTPLSPERFALQLTIGQGTHDKLRRAQELLGHAVPSGDVAEVLDRALDALLAQLEKRKCAATSRPRPRRRSKNERHVPAHVRRKVWQRDGGQCTFESDRGHRCSARTRLEFDHVEAVARGGQATTDGIRLRCRAHNQYTAEQTYGTEFMRHKREEARCRTEQTRAAVGARMRPEAAEDPRDEQDVTPWLRALGLKADEARRAAALCDESIPDGSLEERVKFALRRLAPKGARREVNAGIPGPLTCRAPQPSTEFEAGKFA